MKSKTIFLFFVFCFILLTTLLFGLKPKGYRLFNDVSWLHAPPGIKFGRIGIVFTEDTLRCATIQAPLTVELFCKSTRLRSGIPCIFSFYDGINIAPLIIGQWKSSLAVRLRAEELPKGYRELGVRNALERDSMRQVIVTSDTAGTRIFVNGAQASATQSIIARNSPRLGRIILGNSPAGDQPWQGEIYGVAVYERTFGPEEAVGRFARWKETGFKTPPPANMAIAEYRFAEKGAKWVRNEHGSKHSLKIPRIFQIPQKRILEPPWNNWRSDRGNAADLTVNLLGFMPFGFVATLLILSRRRHAIAQAIFWATLAGCAVSLIIELGQVYIPTRCSQLSDLVLNTAGACAGAWAAAKWLGERKRE